MSSPPNESAALYVYVLVGVVKNEDTFDAPPLSRKAGPQVLKLGLRVQGGVAVTVGKPTYDLD
jgi:hypothetical protein